MAEQLKEANMGKFERLFKSFDKDMTVQEIKDVADYNSTLLFDIHSWLNESGKKAYEAYNVIEFEATFAETIDQLAEGIENHINKQSATGNNVSSSAAKMLRNFCKSYLNREITIKEEKS